MARRGTGGLVSVLSSALGGRECTWVAAAISPGDRAKVGTLSPEATGLPGVSVHMLDVPQDEYDPYYNRLSNRVLWLVNHYLFDPPRTPIFDEEDAAAWDAYQAVNKRFAAAIAEVAPEGASCVVQDYHLALVPPLLRASRPDVGIAQFWHIPFAQPDYLRMLPDEWSRSLIEGLLGADVMGFQTSRWSASFRMSCREVLGARVGERWVKHGGRTTRLGVYPVGVNAAQLSALAADPAVRAERKRLAEWAGDRRLILRVDRTELSKNILRGILAFEALLERRPDMRGNVVHLALLSPSRHDLPEYIAYTQQCVAEAARINERFGECIRMDIEDSIPRAYGAYGIYDVLIVNPVFDGMNLVAHEGPILNRRDGMLVLSQNAGAWTRLSGAAIGINPFSVQETAAALEQAVDAQPEERRERARRLRRLARSHRPERWLLAQLRDLSRVREG
ncbi:MAG: alpha,alpha-trehalose-phosphate synthase (UDP-forming) [Vicinamibacterales bacterium]